MNTIHRSNEVDIIRMAALIGICVVNLPLMALPLETVYLPPPLMHDKFAAFFVEFFFQCKFFLLFSFVFGWGMAVQSQVAELSGQSFVRRYFRRMAGLALFGIAHAIWVFDGDILFLYALLGTLLWLIKDRSPMQLMKIAGVMVLLSIVCFAVVGVLIGNDLVDNAATATAPATPAVPNLGGGFLEATKVRMNDWPYTFLNMLVLQGPLAFGAFATGLAAAKTHFFAENSAGMQWIEQRVPHLLVIALALNLLYAATMSGIVPQTFKIISLLGFSLISIGAPVMSTLYIYGLVRLGRKISVPTPLLLAGRNSLSTYVAQGILAGLVFGAYGLGLFNTLGNLALLAVALLIAMIAMLCVGVWAAAFGRGPLEILLRKISYK